MTDPRTTDDYPADNNPADNNPADKDPADKDPADGNPAGAASSGGRFPDGGSPSAGLSADPSSGAELSGGDLSDAFDAVVIGAGHNGLVAANLLADAGWSVLVVEEQPVPGGAVRSDHVTEPGFVTDLFSSFYPLTAASPVFRRLGLERHGLRWSHAPLVLADPTEDGRCAILSRDLNETATSLESSAAGDGDAWQRLVADYRRIREPLLDTLLSPFPPVQPAARLLARLGPRGAARFLRMALLSPRRLGEEEFAGLAGPVLLAGNALHTDLGPDSAGGAIYGWLLAMLGQDVGFPVPVGGAGALTAALVRRLRGRGGRLVCGMRVTRVLIHDGTAVGVTTADGTAVTARRAVLADVDAPQLFAELVGLDRLPPSVAEDLRRFQWDTATFKVNWALSGPIPWTAEEARRAGTVHVTGWMDGLTRYAAQLAMSRLPAEPMLVLGQTTTADPSRSPAGTESAWAYTHVPIRIVGDERADRGAADVPLTGCWDRAESERFADRIQARIERFAPGFTSLIRARHIQSPLDLQAGDRNLRGGAIGAGTADLHQQLIFRPLASTPARSALSAGIRTPVRRLFLASASAHPGGGVHGACGASAAHAALASARLSRVRPAAARAAARVARRGPRDG